MYSDPLFLKLNIQNTKIMAPGPIISWQIDGETMETVRDFIWGRGSKITDCYSQSNSQVANWNKPSLSPETLVWGLAHTNRGLQRYSQGMEDSECNLCILPLPLSSLPASSRKKLINFFVAQMAMPASRGHLYNTWLWWLEGLMLKGSIGL